MKDNVGTIGPLRGSKLQLGGEAKKAVKAAVDKYFDPGTVLGVNKPDGPEEYVQMCFWVPKKEVDGGLNIITANAWETKVVGEIKEFAAKRKLAVEQDMKAKSDKEAIDQTMAGDLQRLSRPAKLN